MRRLALMLLLIAATGCASKREPPPTADVPPPPPATATPAPAPTTTPPSVSAPWDTAGSASARAARRNHVYPKGANELGQKLVDSLPDPAAMVRGAENEESSAPPPAPKPLPVPVSDSQCWEVQVLVTTNRERAKQEARNIEQRLNLSAWVRESGAMYRVRAGGCLTSDGATELANRLKSQGYPEAFRTPREP